MQVKYIEIIFTSMASMVGDICEKTNQDISIFGVNFFPTFPDLVISPYI